MKRTILLLWLALGLAACTTTGAPHAAAARWAQATVQGDYATTRELAAFQGIEYAFWQGDAESTRQREQFTQYTLASHEQRGESVVFCVEYSGDQLESTLWRTHLHVNQQGQVVTADRIVQGACPEGGQHATR